MKSFLIILSSVFPFCVFCQTEKNFGIGVQLSAVFETTENHGVQPSVLLHFRQHECVIGGRFGFYRILHPVNTSGRKYRAIGVDVAYRYFIPLKISSIRPFVAATFNYFHEYSRSDRNYVYDPYSQAPQYGPVFDYSFNLREESEFEYCGLYLGPGIEVRLRKKLFLNVSGGAGLAWCQFGYKYSDLDSGQTKGAFRRKWMRYEDAQWSGNIGLVYRF
jgi:hypothetical protein